MPSVLMNSPQSSCLRARVVPSRQSSPTAHAETNGDKFLLPCLPTALRSNPAFRRELRNSWSVFSCTNFFTKLCYMSSVVLVR